MSVFHRFGAFLAVAALALAPALPEGLAQPAPAAGIGGATVTVGAVSADEERVACEFAIRAVNNIGEDVRILFSESVMVPGPVLRNSDHFETMSDRWLSPGERLDVRYEVGGRCGASRNWYMVVRIGPRGGETIRIVRRTNDPSDRTIHLGEAACWATARPAPNLPHADRTVDSNDEAAGCDPATTRYGMVPAEDTDDPAADSPAEEIDTDQLQGNWVRVESNNPRNNGMRIRVEGGRATITAMPPRGSSRFRVGQVVWDDVSADASLGVRGSDGAYYPSLLTMEGTNRLHIDVDLENSPGNDQTWERAGPSIDGDWVLYYTVEAYEQNWGIRVRVEGDRATIRYVPPTADRGFRVGDIIWREFSPSDHSSAALYVFESLFGGSTYEPARMSRSTRYEDGAIRSIRIENEAETRPQLWGRPEKAEEVFAKGVGEDEDEGALLDLPHEPVDDPSAQDPDLEPSDDMKTVDLPEPIPGEQDEDEGALLDLPHEPVDDTTAQDPDLEPSDDMKTVDIPEPALPPVPEPAACVATSLVYDSMGIEWGWEIEKPVLPGVTTPRTIESARGPRRLFVADVDRSYAEGPAHFATISRGPGGRRIFRDMSANEFEQRIQTLREEGYRLLDLEGYTEFGSVRYVGVWTRNSEDISWVPAFGLTDSEYHAFYTNRRNAGFRLVDFEAYTTTDGLRYAGIWYRSCDNSNWRQFRNLTDEQFESRDTSLSARGFNIVDFESYETPGGQWYGAIWEKIASRAWSVARDQDLKWFLNHHHRLVDEGLRLIDYESYETPDGIRYAGVWGENSPRYQYAAKDSISSLVQFHRKVNDLPSISAVVVQDGDIVYRRGFGWADVAKEKKAHSGTVYMAASVSKAIGGTLAARLEERGLVDLTDTTSLIPPGVARSNRVTMPSHHTHTVEQLLSKTGCVWHYRQYPDTTTTSNSPSAKYYPWRTDALEASWEYPLLSGCVPGQHYHYSTHGFTVAGAALEYATQVSIAELLRTEIAEPNGLLTMRAMFAAYGLPSNYERATPYKLQDLTEDTTAVPDTLVTPPDSTGSNPSEPISYANNSWKVLGGGIETSTLDLARFGWNTLDGRVVSDSTRDQRLWRSLTNGLRRWSDTTKTAPMVGLAWRVSNTPGRRRAWHGGSWKGARSLLYVWRDQGLVVALMSNRRNHVRHGIVALANEIADAVRSLAP